MITCYSVLVCGGGDRTCGNKVRSGNNVYCLLRDTADVTNWKETDSSVLGLKEREERVFSWTAILTAAHFKSLHCTKKVIIFGKVCYRSPIFYTGKIWLHFLHFNFTFIEMLDFRKEQSRVLSFATDFAVPCTPCKAYIIICLCKF